jgi:hypothetical protein
MEPLTIESLARAIHETGKQAVERFGRIQVREALGGNCTPGGMVKTVPTEDFDDLPEPFRSIRLEQARLMFERIMR